MCNDRYQTLKKVYKNCRIKLCNAFGKPRPCRKRCCPCIQCQIGFRQKLGTITVRSFLQKPPDFVVVLKFRDGEATTEESWTRSLDVFVQKMTDARKSERTDIQYEFRTEFTYRRRLPSPRAHLTLAISGNWSEDKAKQLINVWCAKSFPGRLMRVCVHPIRHMTGYGHYISKNLKDLRKIHPTPPGWKSRLIRRSNGFLIRSSKELWWEHIAELYPNPEPDASLETKKPGTLSLPVPSSSSSLPSESEPQLLPIPLPVTLPWEAVGIVERLPRGRSLGKRDAPR